MIRFSWVTNIPTPYRNHQFERMAAILPELGIEPTVHFMAWHSPGRPWRFARDELRYAWKLHRNPLPPLEHRAVHVNPGLIAELRYGDADAVLVGGWASPSHVAAAFAMPPRTFRILGCESHPGSVGRRGGLVRAAKRAIVSRYDAYLVPGTRARELLVSIDPAAASRPCVTLPNLIDAAMFRDGVARARLARAALRAGLGVEPSTQLWVCPARLIPVKGLLELLPLLTGLRGVELLIAGDGELRSALEALIARDRLPVRLLGQQPVERMVELYAAADVFLLPSRADASPLSAVEAAAAALPLLMSNRCGNVDDLVVEDDNGWILDVDAPEPARRALLERVAVTSRERLVAMGVRSAARYAERFDSDACVRRLGEFIVDHVRARPAR